jgi:hypothetical protein
MTADEIAEAVAAGMHKAIEAATPRLPKLLYTTAETAEITNLPESWLGEEAAAGRIPSCKVGLRYRRFSMADIEAIVAASERPPTSGPLARASRLKRAA